MYWILLGIIFLWVTVWSLKGVTFFDYWNGRKIDEYHVHVWMMIIAFILYCIPVVNILLFTTYITWFTIIIFPKPTNSSCGMYVEIAKENKLHKVLNKLAYYLTMKL